jgi:putative chitinase
MSFFNRLFGKTEPKSPPAAKEVKPLIDGKTLRLILTGCKNPEGWARTLSEVLPIYNITSREALAMFIAQCGQESGHFNTLEENLNYSAEGLMRVWPRHFPSKEIANLYARKPELIASRAYGNRLGNGNEDSREGWKFRGRGLIQVTGKTNYRSCSRFLFKDDRLLDTPELLIITDRTALESACWFWVTNNLNQHASNVDRATRIINGGTHGLEERRALYNRAMFELP